jgi:uncharacterized protein involved in outer membrane biogenesis
MNTVDRIGLWLKSFDRGANRAWLAVGGLVVALIVVAVLILSREDWNVLRGPISRFASAQSGRAVRLDGDLRAHLLSFTPEIDIAGLKIGKPAWAGTGDMADLDVARLQVRLLPLFIGQVEMPLVELKGMKLDLLRDAAGRESWALNRPFVAEPLKLPPISRFVITDGQVRLADETRKIVFTGAVQASEKPTSAGGQGFSLDGDGTLNSEAFKLAASGGPLIAVKRDRPYPFRMDVRAGATHAVLDGRILRPFDMTGMDGTLTISGPDLARLYDLTGIIMPKTPPYNLSGQFQRAGDLYRFWQMTGTVGASDLSGQMAVDKINGRRKLTADLVSQSLNFPDLLAGLGGPPRRSAPSAAPAGPAQIKLSMPTGPSSGAQSPDHRLFPDAPLDTARLRSMDADVRYRANSIRSGLYSLKRGSVTAVLEDGILTLDPLTLDFSEGGLSGRVRIDGRGPVAKTDLDVKAADIGLHQFLREPGATPAIEGLLQARAQLSGVGNSVHQAASTARGEVVFVVPHGRLRQSFAELLGINIGRGLFLLLSKDTRQTDMRCAVAQFDVNGGVMNAQRIVIDTGVVTALGSGVVDLGAERIDLTIKGQTKHPELLRVWTPIKVSGTFDKPALGVDAVAVVAQGGVAAGVSVLLGPIAAILPFVSPGLAHDQDCVGLVADAKQSGAPVKSSSTRISGQKTPTKRG